MNHRLNELKIWHKANDIAVQIYDITKGFPAEEKYNLTSQMRRSAVSISSNIAEGAGRNGTKEFINFLSISNGSSYELLTQIEIASRVKIITPQLAEDLINNLTEIQKMNNGLQKMLKAKL